MRFPDDENKQVLLLQQEMSADRTERGHESSRLEQTPRLPRAAASPDQPAQIQRAAGRKGSYRTYVRQDKHNPPTNTLIREKVISAMIPPMAGTV